MEYKTDEAPMEYICFCGKTKDPEDDLWATPHSVTTAASTRNSAPS